MAVMSATDKLSALEVVKRSGVPQDARRIIEEMTVTNQLLIDAPFVEANDGTVHTHLVRTSVPHAMFRAYNEGVSTVASTTKTVKDSICEIAAYSQVDVRMLENSGHKDEVLMSECSGIIQGMGEQQAEAMIYGSLASNVKSMDGFAIRRPKTDGILCLDAEGTGSETTSVYMVKWGRNFASCIYPRGSQGLGVKREDRGIQDVQDANGNKFPAYVNYFTASFGLSIGHEKSFLRIANIPKTIDGTTLIKTILKAKSHLAPGDGNISILCNSEIMSLMDLATVDKSNVVYTATDPWGNEINKIRDMRIRQCDSILFTETAISAAS